MQEKARGGYVVLEATIQMRAQPYGHMTTAQYRLMGQLRRADWRVQHKHGQWVLNEKMTHQVEVLDPDVVTWMFGQGYLTCRDRIGHPQVAGEDPDLYSLTEQAHYDYDAENRR
jgi:hypothetical protein